MRGRFLSCLTLLVAACAPTDGAVRDMVELRTWATGLWQPAGISSTQFESHPAFDRANRTLYFVRSNPSFAGWKILESHCRKGAWSEPQPPSFAGKGVEADPFLTPDGKRLYFISTRRDDGVTGRGLDIWYVERTGPSSGWGRPVRLSQRVNSAGAEWFPRPARDGWLYFGSDRPGGFGATDIYRARLVRGFWKVENLGREVNGSGDEYEAEISPDGSRMILMADGDLYLLTYRNGAWRNRTKLGPEINTGEIEVGALFSPDGKAFLFARDFGKAALPVGGSGELVLASNGGSGSWPPSCR
jgi:hypothetical protein